MITRKSSEQIALMRRAGKVVAEMHEECIRAAKAGLVEVRFASRLPLVVVKTVSSAPITPVALGSNDRSSGNPTAVRSFLSASREACMSRAASICCS